MKKSPISVVSQNIQKSLLSELERNSRTPRPERQQNLVPWSHFQVYIWTILNILSHSTPFPPFPSALGVFPLWLHLSPFLSRHLRAVPQFHHLQVALALMSNSEKPGMVWDGRNFKNHPIPTPMPWPGSNPCYPKPPKKTRTNRLASPWLKYTPGTALRRQDMGEWLLI